MSELLVLGLKLLFLALLWLFVFFSLAVVRNDLVGRAATAPAGEDATELIPALTAPSASTSRRRGRRPRRWPSTIRVVAGPQAGLTLALGDSFLIGRTPEAQLVLDDTYMSTRHARFTLTDAGYVLEDLGSTNGTFVNEQRIGGPTLVDTTSSVRIGHTVMALER